MAMESRSVLPLITGKSFFLLSHLWPQWKSTFTHMVVIARCRLAFWRQLLHTRLLLTALVWVQHLPPSRVDPPNG